MPSCDAVEGRLDLGFVSTPPAWLFKDEDQFERFQKAIVLQEIEEIEYFSKRYDLSGYVSLNQMSPISLTEWLGSGDSFTRLYGLPNIIKKALSHQASEIARQIDQKRKEQQDELMAHQRDFNTSLNFGSSNSSVNKVFGS
jgi:hypothetical protein